MATQTTNLNLTKPAYSEDADVAVINSNMDILDGKIGAVGSTSLQAQATANSTSIGKIIPKITTTTNNSGYAIAAGDYFEANGILYKATAAIPKNSAWSSSATAQGDTVHGALNGAFDTLNSKILHSITSNNDYEFPSYASEISNNNDKYIVQHNGVASITIMFDSNNYSQIALLLNNKYILDNNKMVSSNGNNLENQRVYFQLPVFVGDEIKVGFYSTYGVKAATLRLLY